MEIDHPTLYVEINDTNYIFVANIYDENQNLKVVEKIIAPSAGIDKSKFISIDQAAEEIKKNVAIIEKKLNYIFQDVTVLIDNFDYSCINISGFKKLNGSQVLKENISYILNSLKLAVTENEKQKTILHIFNSNSILDGIRIDNLPIGLFGDFYSHELTFFLIRNNDLKNIQKMFNKNNLNIKKVILKNFGEGVQLINRNKDTETFFKIKIAEDISQINFFDNSSFRYSENFNFGTNIIFRDIEKICSLDNKIIRRFLSNSFLNKKNFNDNEILEEDYFTKGNFRKIRKKLISDIADARINEITHIIFNKNINIESLKGNKIKIYLIIKDKQILENFKESFKSYFSQNNNFEIYLINDFEIDESIMSVANLSIYGWKKEAIPTIKLKNSLITRIFKSLFG
ncbi:hypothetical protein IDH12_04480 [Pelagibacterales bacterium SAG-MED29]|nr:hypothetical protein [Pelagibacterales bacterium SAG-MED29]